MTKPKKSRAAKALKRWREQAELTHVSAAKRLKTSQATYTRLERGVQLPRLKLAIRIEDHLDIPVRHWLR